MVYVMAVKADKVKKTTRKWDESMEFFDTMKTAFPDLNKDLFIECLKKEAEERNIVFA